MERRVISRSPATLLECLAHGSQFDSVADVSVKPERLLTEAVQSASIAFLDESRVLSPDVHPEILHHIRGPIGTEPARDTLGMVEAVVEMNLSNVSGQLLHRSEMNVAVSTTARKCVKCEHMGA